MNDGSKDQSLKICNEYGEKDPRVIVLNKANEGVSVARNIGIIKSTGKYIQFVDSDDFVEKNMTELLVDSINKYDSDMAICGINSFDERKLSNKNKNIDIIRTDSSKNYYTINEFLEVLLQFKTDVFFGSPDNKLFKKDLIIRNQIMFRPNINFAEDFIFNLDYFQYLDSISVVNKVLYNYRRNVETSITKTERKTEEFWVQFKEIFDSYKKTFNELGSYDGNIEKINSFMIWALIATIWNCNKQFPGIKNKEKAKIIRTICDDSIISEIKENVYYYSKNEKKIVYLLKKRKYSLINNIYSVKFSIYRTLKRQLTFLQDIKRMRR